MENSKIAKAIATNENLIFMGSVMVFLGFYAIAELQVLTGILMVFSGYGTIFTSTKFARKIFTSFDLKLIKTEKDRIKILSQSLG